MKNDSKIKCSNCNHIVTNPVLNAYDVGKKFCNKCGYELKD